MHRERDRDEPPPQAGDLICGECGVGNIPTRKYCRGCGRSLIDARVVPEPPWWKRLFTRRPKQKPNAGDRPGRRQWRRPGCLVPLIVIAVVLGVGYALRSHAEGALESVRDRTSKTEQVHAVKVTASSAQEGHPASLAVDGTTDRYWAPAEPGAGEGEFLEAVFAEPVRLLDLVLYPGVAPVAERFLTQGRPREVLVAVTAEDGRVTTKTLRVADEPGKQTFHVPVSDAVRVRLTVRSAYGAGPAKRVALAEAEFFKRR
ncbi:discoidin domain-containing protein [Streptomyces sp. NPDC086023]|uniref:discoidin domain-containing protein n=1 Tax=Streptomyces sp. NPDC086023 TaxID=3365746 RepID=UPI0037CE9B06